MTDFLLKELDSTEVDWLLKAGKRISLSSDTTLPLSGEPLGMLHILLDGLWTLAFLPPQLAMTEEAEPIEVLRLLPGELVGGLSCLGADSTILRVQARSPCQMLMVPVLPLVEKLQSDPGFATHFYRAVASQLAKRLEAIAQVLIDCADLTPFQAQSSITPLAELQSSDLDWLMAAGTLQTLPQDTPLAQSNRPLDALQIVLDGAIALSLSAGYQERFCSIFCSSTEMDTTEFITLVTGEMLGELRFLDVTAPAIAAYTVRNSQILSVPRRLLAIKLLQDEGFASRFYRMVALRLAERMEAIARFFCESIESIG